MWGFKTPSKVTTFLLGLVALTGASLFDGQGEAAAQQTPQFLPDKHLGVTSCAGSTCHGSIEPWANSVVLQNEYVTWQQKDRHSKAYDVLLSERSQRIARNLGLENAATADVCLDCHADNIPAELRGRTFQISDGVGCEACHGGSERWLGVHLTGGGHANNVQAGMYSTVDPVKRAKLCLGCHFGDSKKFVTHRIMGAGHPRMPFELDTFTWSQPAHFRIDDDYAKRKQVTNGVQTWAIGQALAMQNILTLLTDPKRSHDGIFPELVFFDCHACHHPMSNLRWQPRASTGLGPGVVRLNDANLVMLRVIAGHVAPELGDMLQDQTRALHQASTDGIDATGAAVAALQDTLSQLIEKFASHSFGGDDMKALLKGVIDEGLRGEYVDYAAAEQATMAIGSILDAMQKAGLIDQATFDAMGAKLDEAYASVEKDEAYKPATYVAALQALKESASGL
ncbi:multiheme c-type cytochrome [Oceanibacterium hippocampi]|uniref:Cytochrome c-552/4 domain-containing protein n=1 Tax=Oceanibacterium hippocampi TaxID=745714 RepID=A0A1Y5TC97_9PROT|nr:multiheme c-type cytochrome [Oceanibacterium hippocampi]SLN57182.1 hypothetical protein OCH7691_02491 [Oceanibacterium hippocampi]